MQNVRPDLADALYRGARQTAREAIVEVIALCTDLGTKLDTAGSQIDATDIDTMTTCVKALVHTQGLLDNALATQTLIQACAQPHIDTASWKAVAAANGL